MMLNSVSPFEHLQLFLDSQTFRDSAMDLDGACRIFHVSRSGYYSWLARKKDTEKQRQKAMRLEELKDMVKRIIRRLGFVPGKRTLHTHFVRLFGMKVSVKKCRWLLETMHLTANKPLKDAYKHQATHDHEYATEIANIVDRDFFVGARKVILTDITYLYFGSARITFYACIFHDAYTNEPLGFACSMKMTVEDLVQPAYDMMMREHGSELKHPDVLIHSDQGSQYLSTSFKQLLSDNEFVQSVSNRGNSLDNSPMESFFSLMKARVLATVALAKDFETASEMVTNYLLMHKFEICQYRLGGLTPHEFYEYLVSGVYPCDTYFGISAERLRTVNALIADRKKASEEIAEKARKRAEQQKEEGKPIGKNPMRVVMRDENILQREIAKWEKQQATAENQVVFLKSVLEKAQAAHVFISQADPALKEALYDRKEWQRHEELSYVKSMDGLF